MQEQHETTATLKGSPRKNGMAAEEGDVFHDSLQEYRLLVIGKTGNGKSSVGNIILGRRHFQVGCSMTSTTLKPASGVTNFNGLQVKVIDTPDLTNLGLVDDDAQQEICTWKALTLPEPHAILLAVRCDVRYTREEHEIFLRLKRFWGCNSFCRRLVVVFTFGDRQDEDLGRELKSVCQELKSVLKDASHRYVLFNDRDSLQGKTTQVKNLLQVVQRLDHEAKNEVRRLLFGVQVCPQGPSVSLLKASVKQARHSLSSHSSQGSTGSSTSDGDAIRLLLVGRPGNGKSSTGNTILGRAEFPVYSHRHTGHAASRHDVQIDGRTFQVIDTPGLQTGREDEEYQQERRTALDLTMPGPHALLFVVRHRQVTDDDLTGFRTLTQQLGQGLSHHTVVVLVGAPNDPNQGPGPGSAFPVTSHHPLAASQSATGAAAKVMEGTRYQDEGLIFSALLQEAGGKLWVVDNIEKDPTIRQDQVNALVKTVQEILNNSGGNCFHGDQVAMEMARARHAQEMTKNRARKNSCWFL